VPDQAGVAAWGAVFALAPGQSSFYPLVGQPPIGTATITVPGSMAAYQTVPMPSRFLITEVDMSVDVTNVDARGAAIIAGGMYIAEWDNISGNPNWQYQSPYGSGGGITLGSDATREDWLWDEIQHHSFLGVPVANVDAHCRQTWYRKRIKCNINLKTGEALCITLSNNGNSAPTVYYSYHYRLKVRRMY